MATDLVIFEKYVILCSYGSKNEKKSVATRYAPYTERVQRREYDSVPGV